MCDWSSASEVKLCSGSGSTWSCFIFSGRSAGRWRVWSCGNCCRDMPASGFIRKILLLPLMANLSVFSLSLTPLAVAVKLAAASPAVVISAASGRGKGGCCCAYSSGIISMATTDASRESSKASASSRRSGSGTALSSFRPPDVWREQLEGVREMRRLRDAAVDTAGANALKNSSVGSPSEVRFQVLMSAMLSSQTKDPITAAALERMREACAPVSLGAEALSAALDEGSLAALLHPVSFAKTKAKHIKLVCERLSVSEEGRDAGDIPSTVEGLLGLPGVGPKMTFLVMDVAWGRNEGICVDTHVHRVSNRLGWVDTWNRTKNRAQNPEKTRKHLQAWLPREHWSEINPLLVGFGQQVCSAISPSCSICGINDICPSAETK